jgi:tetratricopeptide (TPR) repeat protein
MARWNLFSSAVRVVAAAALIAVSGCAAREAKFASRFVKPGEPSALFDDPASAPASQAPLSDYVRKVRALQSKAVTKNSLLPTIESSDSTLSKALFALAIRESSEHHRIVAAAYRRAGILDYAYRHYQRASVLEPCDAASYDGMARIWRDWGMPNLALSEVYRALHCNQKSAEIHNTLGTVLEALGQPANARQAYEHAVALDPRATFALNNLCVLEVDAGNAAAAAPYCERALAIDGTFAAARNNLALVEARSGDMAGAERRLRGAGATDAVSIYNVGVMRWSEGRYAEAAAEFGQAAAVQPSLAIARQRLVQARQAARAAEQGR